MLTELENTLNNFIEVYHKYSMLQGNDHALYRDDLKKLLEAECPQCLKVRCGWVSPGFCMALMMPGAPGPPVAPGKWPLFSSHFDLYTLLLSPHS